MLHVRRDPAAVSVAADRLGVAARVLADHLRTHLPAAALLVARDEAGHRVLADRQLPAAGIASAARVYQLALLGRRAVVGGLGHRDRLVGRPGPAARGEQREAGDRDPGERRHRRSTRAPANRASSPSWSAIRSSWLYFATRSERDAEPVLI